MSQRTRSDFNVHGVKEQDFANLGAMYPTGEYWAPNSFRVHIVVDKQTVHSVYWYQAEVKA